MSLAQAGMSVKMQEIAAGGPETKATLRHRKGQSFSQRREKWDTRIVQLLNHVEFLIAGERTA
jgi:hypothetical protein